MVRNGMKVYGREGEGQERDGRRQWEGEDCFLGFGGGSGHSLHLRTERDRYNDLSSGASTPYKRWSKCTMEK